MLGRHIIKASGDSSSAPLIFLHGFGGVATQWDEWLEKFSPLTDCAAYALPGHVGSLDYPNFGPPKVAARAIIEALEEDFPGRKVHIVGHSMGGAVSSLIALFAPEKVASLVLLAPGGFGPEIDISSLKAWAKAQKSEEFRNLLPRFFAPGFNIPDEMIEMHAEARQTPGANEALVKISGEIAPEGTQGTLPLDTIVKTGVPISVIWGTEDTIIPVSHALAVKDMMDVHIVDGMGHMPDAEAPELLEQLLRERLGS